MISFHRRLIILATVFIAVLIVLIAQVSLLTISQGEERFIKASGRLHATSYLPTWRGRILDRKGRVIAEDVASYNVSVDGDLITGERVRNLAKKDAKSKVDRDTWNSISSEQREELIAAMLPQREEELNHFWNIIALEGGISIEELQRRVAIIKKEVEQTAKAVWVNQEEAYRIRYGNEEPFDKEPIREQREPHVVLARVSDALAVRFSLLSDLLDGAIHVEHSRKRDYPMRHQTVFLDRSTLPNPMVAFDTIEVKLENVAELIVGDVRDGVWGEDMQRNHGVWKEDMRRNPFRVKDVVDLRGYRAGDEVGNRGIESSMEKTLRGVRGQVVKRRGGEELSRIQPRGGVDVQITLDMKLQARIEGVMSHELGLMQVQPWHRNATPMAGMPLRGAVVVLDVKTSEVLALVSTPAKRDEHDKDGYPWLNRATQGYYPPGSIVKPLVLVSAMTEGKLKHGESIECAGHFFPNVKNVARCWLYRDIYKFRTHGHLEPVEAIARSCNIFFYELGDRLGFAKLVHWLQGFGMSKPLSAQLTNSDSQGSEGHFLDEDAIQDLKNKGALTFETVSISIGQGALTWSPLHAAASYATLARGGIWKSPSLLTGMKQNEHDLSLDKEAVALALGGLHHSVTKKYGTGSQLRYGTNDSEPTFTIDGVRIWGKTGTAQAPPYKLRIDSKPIKKLDHSWFLVMASSIDEAKPTVVVAVLVEHGGSGGRVAGPIANQVLHALQAEGYLERKP